MAILNFCEILKTFLRIKRKILFSFLNMIPEKCFTLNVESKPVKTRKKALLKNDQGRFETFPAFKSVQELWYDFDVSK